MMRLFVGAHFAGVSKCARLFVLCVAGLSACGGKPPPPVLALSDCAQPSAEALSAAERLPRLPAPSADPREEIDALTLTLERDEDVHDAEIDKRETLIAHGVRFCGWSR